MHDGVEAVVLRLDDVGLEDRSGIGETQRASILVPGARVFESIITRVERPLCMLGAVREARARQHDALTTVDGPRKRLRVEDEGRPVPQLVAEGVALVRHVDVDDVHARRELRRVAGHLRRRLPLDGTRPGADLHGLARGREAGSLYDQRPLAVGEDRAAL